MKKIFLIPLVFMQAELYGQAISNASFENWTTTIHYEDPNGFFSTNNWVYMSLQSGNVVKSASAYHGSFAAQLTTVQLPGDTAFGGIFIGTPSQSGISGGAPYSDQPDSVSAYVKYNIQPNDTGFVIVAFKNNGIMIAMAGIPLVGVQNTYKRIVFPTLLPVSPAPDTLVAIIVCSRFDPPQFPGSTLTIDSITLIGATQTFPNPSFENWTALSSEEPDDWNTLNFASATIPSATKSTSSFSGTYSLRLETVPLTWGDTMGFITNGYLGGNGPAGGMQVFSNPLKVTGYYKYFPAGNDTALGNAFTYISGILIDSSMIQFLPQTAYTYFEIPLAYNSWPYIDTLNISFSSSNMLDSAYTALGSVLYIDDLTAVYNPVGIEEEPGSASVSFFPNPFSDAAVLSFDNPQNEKCELLVYDVLGNEVMKNQNINSGTVIIDRKNLPAGIYEYRIIRNKNIAGRGKFVVR